MEICKAPTLRLKVLNKHNTHNVHRDGKCYQQFNKKLTHDVDIKTRSIITMWKMHTHTHTHAHTHTVQTDRGEGQCCLTEIFWEEKRLEFAFEGRESSLISRTRLFYRLSPIIMLFSIWGHWLSKMKTKPSLFFLCWCFKQCTSQHT